MQLKLRIRLYKSNAIPVHPITAGSAKLPGWPIREAIRPWKIIRGPIRKTKGNEDPMQRVNYLIHCTLRMRTERRKGRVRERHQKISGEVGNMERTKDGTNKMRDMSERPN